MNSKINNYKLWTITEDLRLEELVKTSNYSFKEIGKILNRTGRSCQDHSIYLGLTNNYLYKKYNYNKDFWDIPNILNSYWAGMVAADGHIRKSKESYHFALSLATEDHFHLERFKQDILYDGPISIYKRNRISNSKNKELKTYSTSNVNINGIKWGLDLERNFNIIPNKTKRLEPPNILNKCLLFSWLIGYTCGDGTIFLNKKTNQLYIKYVSSSEYIINWIKSFIEEYFKNCGIRNTTRNINKNKFCYAWHYNISGIMAAVIIDYLRQFPVPKLDRKWNNPDVIEYINFKKQEYPHLFKTLNYNEIKDLLPNNISHL